MASTVTTALSRVMTLCEGTSSTVSIMFILAPIAVYYGDDERETRLEGANITAESLDRPFIPLGDPLNRKNDKNQCEQDHEEYEDGEGAEHDTVPSAVAFWYSIHHSLR